MIFALLIRLSISIMLNMILENYRISFILIMMLSIHLYLMKFLKSYKNGEISLEKALDKLK